MGKPSAFEKVRKEYKNSEFKYGSYDCCLFAKQALEAYHEIKIDYYAEYEGHISQIKANFKAAGVTVLKDYLKAVARLNKWKQVQKKQFMPPRVFLS